MSSGARWNWWGGRGWGSFECTFWLLARGRLTNTHRIDMTVHNIYIYYKASINIRFFIYLQMQLCHVSTVTLRLSYTRCIWINYLILAVFLSTLIIIEQYWCSALIEKRISCQSISVLSTCQETFSSVF